MESAATKQQALVRFLNLVPYFRAHPGASAMEAARDLGMTPKELKESLERLMCVGVGRWTEELIDFQIEDYRSITLVADQGITRPLRLTRTEAGALLLTLEALESVPGLLDGDAVNSAAAKLRAIMDAKATAIYDSIADVDAVESETQRKVAQALLEGKKLAFDYAPDSSAPIARREVSPARVFLYDSETYVVGWDDSREAHRTFRIDRMSNCDVLVDPAQPHVRELDFDESDPFGFGHAGVAELEIHPDFTWLARYHNMTLGEEGENGWFSATMPVTSEDWTVRFVLSQGDRLRVVGPKTLCESVAERTRAAIDRYTR